MTYVCIQHMKRTTVFLYESTECDLKALARQQGRPVADMIREAISDYVTREKEKSRPPLRFLGIGRSGHTDTAERHEEILAAEFAPHPVAGPARARSRTSSRTPAKASAVAPGRRR